VNFPGGP
jgi:tRNA G10  N-methylase Trm11